MGIPDLSFASGSTCHLPMGNGAVVQLIKGDVRSDCDSGRVWE
jgi:hypothetical protein